MLEVQEEPGMSKRARRGLAPVSESLPPTGLGALSGDLDVSTHSIPCGTLNRVGRVGSTVGRFPTVEHS